MKLALSRKEDFLFATATHFNVETNPKLNSQDKSALSTLSTLIFNGTQHHNLVLDDNSIKILLMCLTYIKNHLTLYNHDVNKHRIPYQFNKNEVQTVITKFKKWHQAN